MTERCICCGANIPEGRQVCPICEGTVAGKMIDKRQREKAIIEAYETIITYCKEREGCNGCCFFDESSEICQFALCDLPCDWRLHD